MYYPVTTNNTSLPVIPPFLAALKPATWYTYIMLIISILAFIICSVAMLFIYGKSRKLLERNSNIMLFALLGTHNCIGILCTIAFSLEFALGISVHGKNDVFMIQIMTIIHFLYIQAFMMITVITLDRLIAVNCSFYYERCTWKSCAIMIGIFTVPGASFLLIRFTTHLRDVYYMFVLSGCFLSVFICVANYILFRKVREELNKIYNVTVTGDAVAQMKKLQSVQLRRRKSATICLMLTMSTVLTLLPSEISTIQLVVVGLPFWNELTIKIVKVADIVVLANSLKDPLIYILLNKEVRQEICRFMTQILLHQKIFATPGENNSKIRLAQQRACANSISEDQNNNIERASDEVEICGQRIIRQTVFEKTETLKVSETRKLEINKRRSDTPILSKKQLIRKSYSSESKSSMINEVKASNNATSYG